MDQGQIGRNLWYAEFAESKDNFLDWNPDGKLLNIPRDVGFDYGSLMQVDRAEWTHLPQSSLHPDTPIQMGIAPNRLEREPFRIRRTFPENNVLSAGTQLVVNAKIEPQQVELANVPISLWSRDLDQNAIIRFSGEFADFAKTTFPFPAGHSQRQYIVMLAAETLQNYNPGVFNFNDIFAQRIVQTGPILERIVAGEKQLMRQTGKNDSIEDFYLSVITKKNASVEKGLQSRNRQRVVNSVAVRAMREIEGRTWRSLFENNKTAALVAWLLMPHPADVTEASDTLTYALFSLAHVVKTNRFPTRDEWDARRQQMGKPGFQKRGAMVQNELLQKYTNDPAMQQMALLGKTVQGIAGITGNENLQNFADNFSTGINTYTGGVQAVGDLYRDASALLEDIFGDNTLQDVDNQDYHNARTGNVDIGQNYDYVDNEDGEQPAAPEDTPAEPEATPTVPEEGPEEDLGPLPRLDPRPDPRQMGPRLDPRMPVPWDDPRVRSFRI